MSESFENPYFEEVAGGVTVGGNRHSHSDAHFETFVRREELVPKYAWAIPNEEAIDAIAQYDPILEVGAGGGYWAHLIAQKGAEVLATDIDAPEEDPWYPVWEADARVVIHDYPHRTLLMVWPTYGESWATETLGAYQGDTVIYVGEGRGGCTADETFHRLLYDQYEHVETVAIPQYMGIKDRLEIWEVLP